VATPAPAPAPAPAAAAARPTTPAIVAPGIAAPAAAKPVAPPATPAAPAKRDVAVAAPSSASAAPPKLDARTVEQIFSCLAPGLPQDWKKAWIVVSAPEAGAPAKFLVTSTFRDEDAESFVPCNAQELARRVAGLSDALVPDQRRWSSARLLIDSEGQYQLTYDYAR
jgi:hypothetical protein